MCKYGYKTENARIGMRAAIAKRFSGDAAPERLHFSVFQSVSVTRRVLGSAPEARSAEGDEGGAAALVSLAADLFKTVTYFYGHSI